jgi:putative transposase
VNERVARSRALIAKGHRPTVVTRVLQVSRQSVYRPISRRPASAGPGHGRPGDEGIVEVAKANPTDGTRMVAALASRELGEAVNRKRVQRVMREHRLLQRTRNTDRRCRPGFFRVTRPDELWHLDMTKVWTAAHGWVYLHVAVDCCTREVACWRVDLRTRAEEAIACVEAGLLARAVPPGRLTLGSDNGSQFTARDFRKHLSARGVTHRRGGYRDPESQAFIESWFGQFKKRCAWRAEWETIEQARAEIGDYIERYHRRPHSGIGYRTPTEVAATWRPNPEAEDLQTLAT